MNAQVQIHHEVRVIPLDELHISPLSVRKTGGTRIDSLAASIEARGLIHNLTVVPRPFGGKTLPQDCRCVTQGDSAAARK